MKFEEALKEYRNGKKIDVYENHKKKYLVGKTWELQKLFDLDWVVLEEPGKTFDQVFKDFKEGKSIKRKSWPIGMRKIAICDHYFSTQDLLSDDWEVISE